jgi:hypothetical protein
VNSLRTGAPVGDADELRGPSVNRRKYVNVSEQSREVVAGHDSFAAHHQHEDSWASVAGNINISYEYVWSPYTAFNLR